MSSEVDNVMEFKKPHSFPMQELETNMILSIAQLFQHTQSLYILPLKRDCESVITLLDVTIADVVAILCARCKISEHSNIARKLCGETLQCSLTIAAAGFLDGLALK